jgi:DNA repair protein RecN (Recombination protein N)
MDLVSEQEALNRDEQSAAREIDLLTHQVNEIEAARLEPDEEEPLVVRQRSAANARRLGELSTEMLARITESDDSIANRLGETVRIARELARIDPAAEPIATMAVDLSEAAADLGRQLDNYTAGLEADPSKLAEIESRLDTIQVLKRKYGRTVEEVIAFGQSASGRLASIQSRDERRQDLGKQIAEALKALAAAGSDLTSRRKSGAPKLAKAAKAHLSDLGFLRSEFSIHLEAQPEPGPDGCEIAEFLFAPNPGEPAQPLRSIASSGEISRVMLALKTALAAQDGVPVLVFDEIDANVGGETGAKVGAKMRELGESRQVFCITHLPQVAACATAHFIVAKEVRNGRTSTQLAEAAGQDREEELARMLGGRSESALAHAREMLVKA